MISKTLALATLAAILVPVSATSAKQPAPLMLTALVEQVSGNSADVEFMDYVGIGQTIKLGPQYSLTLSYLKSCAHETITGGTVLIGSDQSEVQGGKVSRTKVACNGGNIKLSAQQANASGASAFRLQSAAFNPSVFAVSPVVQIPKLTAGESRKLVIEPAKGRGQRVEIEMAESLASGGFYDLATAKKRLTRGVIYTATLGSHKVTFKVDANAKSGKAPIISRLLQFQPG